MAKNTPTQNRTEVQRLEDVDAIHYTIRATQIATLARLELARPKDNALAGRRVNHSATVSNYIFEGDIPLTIYYVLRFILFLYIFIGQMCV